MDDNISLKQARKVWKGYQEHEHCADVATDLGEIVQATCLAEHLKARFDRIMSARSQRNRKPTAEAVKVAEDAR